MSDTSGTPINPDRLTANYIDATVRGQIRTWKAGLMLRYDETDLVYQSKAFRDLAMEFCRSTGIGRKRRFDRLIKMLAYAELAGACLTGRRPLVIWSALKPRVAVRVAEAAGHGAVTVEYITIYVMNGMANVGDGLWTMEITDHALGRFMHRSPGIDPALVVMGAHRELLHLSLDAVAPGRKIDGEARFLLRYGKGGFVCSLRGGLDVSLGGNTSIHAYVHSWLDDDLVAGADLIIPERGAGSERLGMGVLLPAPLKLITSEGIYGWPEALKALGF